MRVSRTIAYAIGAAVQLAEMPADHIVPCKTLAAKNSWPERFLLQILRVLVTQGVLTSNRGADGGFKLARPPNQISLLQIVEAFDYSTVPHVPSFAGVTPEAFHRVYLAFRNANEQARKELAKVTLADLSAAQTPVPAPGEPREK